MTLAIRINIIVLIWLCMEHFQNLATGTGKDVFLQRRRVGPGNTKKGWFLRPDRTGGIKKRLSAISNPPENTIYASLRCNSSHRVGFSYGRRRKPVKRLIANRWIRFKQSVSAIQFSWKCLRSVLKKWPNQCVKISRVNADMKSSAKD